MSGEGFILEIGNRLTGFQVIVEEVFREHSNIPVPVREVKTRLEG